MPCKCEASKTTIQGGTATIRTDMNTKWTGDGCLLYSIFLHPADDESSFTEFEFPAPSSANQDMVIEIRDTDAYNTIYYIQPGDKASNQGISQLDMGPRQCYISDGALRWEETTCKCSRSCRECTPPSASLFPAGTNGENIKNDIVTKFGHPYLGGENCEHYPLKLNSIASAQSTFTTFIFPPANAGNAGKTIEIDDQDTHRTDYYINDGDYNSNNKWRPDDHGFPDNGDVPQTCFTSDGRIWRASVCTHIDQHLCCTYPGLILTNLIGVGPGDRAAEPDTETCSECANLASGALAYDAGCIIQTCVAGKELDSDSNTCKDCENSVNVQTYSGDTGCTIDTCTDGSRYDQTLDRCVPCNVANAATYIPGSCDVQTCYPGFKLDDAQTQCVDCGVVQATGYHTVESVSPPSCGVLECATGFEPDTAESFCVSTPESTVDTLNVEDPASSTDSTDNGVLIGAIVGGVVFLALVGGLVAFFVKKKNSGGSQSGGQKQDAVQEQNDGLLAVPAQEEPAGAGADDAPAAAPANEMVEEL